MIKIKELPSKERPREKALTYGIDSLNNRELLAILLRTGYKASSALDVADELLKKFASINGILNASTAELSAIKGISKSKSLELLAIGELSKRANEQPLKKFGSPREIYSFYRKRWESSKGEEIILLSVNRTKSLIAEHTLSFNNQSFSSLSIGQTLSTALKDGAHAFILIHNHPSGFPLPSSEDIEFSYQLNESAEKLGLIFLDHIIVGNDSYFSFSEEKLFKSWIK